MLFIDIGYTGMTADDYTNLPGGLDNLTQDQRDMLDILSDMLDADLNN